MPWPWVSREFLDQSIKVRDEQIAELRSEKKRLEQERQRLLDFIATGATGQPIYREPPVVAREAETPEREPDLVHDAMPGPVQRAVEAHGSRARKVTTAVQRDVERRYEADTVAGRLAAEEAIREGQMAAVNSNGNK